MRRSDGVKFAVLGLIASNSEGVHGYALGHQCVRVLGHLWQLTLQEIYRTLTSLAADGWIAADGRDPVAGRKVYSITALGRQSLDAFLQRPAMDLLRPRRQELAAKILFARPEQLTGLVGLLNARRDFYQQELAQLAIQRRRLRRLPVDPFLINLLIDGDEGSVLAEIEWLSNVSQKLTERLGGPAA